MMRLIHSRPVNFSDKIAKAFPQGETYKSNWAGFHCALKRISK